MSARLYIYREFTLCRSSLVYLFDFFNWRYWFGVFHACHVHVLSRSDHLLKGIHCSFTEYCWV